MYDGDPSGEGVSALSETSITIDSQPLETIEGNIQITYEESFAANVTWVDGAESGGRPTEQEFEEAVIAAGSFTLTKLNEDETPTDNKTTYAITVASLYYCFGENYAGVIDYINSGISLNGVNITNLPSQITTRDDYGNPTHIHSRVELHPRPTSKAIWRNPILKTPLGTTSTKRSSRSR